jgi:hypothetical protein
MLKQFQLVQNMELNWLKFNVRRNRKVCLEIINEIIQAGSKQVNSEAHR